MAAIEVRGAYKFYGSDNGNKRKATILNYLNMNVMYGSIYGLLGASGCGKTTLLSCIVGQRILNKGEIHVLGVKPGLPGSGVPGPRIGYMPQEIALVEEMTVKETIFYFGRIYDLNEEHLEARYNILKNLLELPESDKLIRICSGGQQRRISFACAMVHEPELLILDEPTVGLDPILREKIWSFLVSTTRNSKLAVVITTHYIEEARKADYIGLMRNGILLAEDSPENIMRKYETNSIEDAFLFLSQRQGTIEDVCSGNTNVDSTIGVVTSFELDVEKRGKKFLNKTQITSNFSIEKSQNMRKKYSFTTRSRMKALMLKNIVQLIRQPSGMIFMFLFPILQLSCFYLAIGKDPKNLKLGIVNEEIYNNEICANKTIIHTYVHDFGCDFYKISCRFLNELDDKVAEKIYYNTVEEAFSAAKKTHIIGYIQFSQNFSESLQKILEAGRFADDEWITYSQLSVQIDMSDQQIAYFIERKLRDAFKRFMEDLMVDCNLPKSLGNTPIRFEKPLFGSFNDEYRKYIAPGVIMTMIFFLATLITAAIFIAERSDGIWDRTLIAGISTSEMLIAHILSQSSIMILQCLEVIIYVAVVFETENRGDNFTVIVLLALTGFSGMLFGLLISVYCKTHTMANFVATGAFYPMIMLCGLLWPIEGMPTLLRNIALTFPFTIPTVSVRNILEKGWSIKNAQVYNGFVVMLLWIVALFVCCIIGLRRKT